MKIFNPTVSLIRMLGFILLTTFFLAACELPVPLPPVRPGPTTRAEYIYALEEQRVQIIQTGETIIAIIPSDKIFNPDSANFSVQSEKILPYLAAILVPYETRVLRINGYTDNCGSPLRNQVLSEKQARRVAAYLISQGIDARLIYPLGLGQMHPVATNETEEGRAQNRRIEIRFRYVVIPPLV